ncbi:MAG TPA: DUF92 domain-containing protein [Cytophagaceae bacterium]|jgi:uncharacterized protein (TIGR00297 family)
MTSLPLWINIAAQLFSLSVGALSYYKKSVSKSGLAALVISSALFIWLDHLPLLFILFFMFLSSSLLTKYKKELKSEVEKVVAKTGPRDYVQALANLGVATIIMLIFAVYHSDVILACFIGSVAAANADSWASEIGGLSNRKPVSIVTFKHVEKGISGGVTLLGLIGGILGSLFISALALATLHVFSAYSGNYILLFISTAFAGFIGCILDSYLGATLQALYKNQKDEYTENPMGAQLAKGIRGINNDMVNFLTTLSSAGVAGLIFILIQKLF